MINLRDGFGFLEMSSSNVYAECFEHLGELRGGRMFVCEM